MNTIDAMDRLKRIDPVESDLIAAGISDEAFDEMLGSILDAPEPEPETRPAPRRPRRLWSLPRIAVGLAVVCLIAIVVALSGRLDLNGTSDPGRAWAAELVEFAEQSPLVLLDPAYWDVKTIDQRAGSGSITFRHRSMIKGGPDVSGTKLGWTDEYSLEDAPDHQTEGLTDMRVAEDVPVLDTTAAIEEGARRGDLRSYSAAWEYEGLTMTLVGDARTLEDFETLLSQVESEDVDSWLQAMPGRVIAREKQAAGGKVPIK